jgi:hypothetical protein
MEVVMRSGLISVVSGSRAKWKLLLPAVVVVAAIAVLAEPAAATLGSFIGGFNNVMTVASTVPKNGDVNPYGVAVAPATTGSLVQGDILVSNFNNHRNLQGTGSTIVQISPSGDVSLFASLAPNKLPGACPGGLGLTTALVVLQSGWVVVGSLPTKDGSSATAQAGCLIVLNSSGKAVKTISGAPINGPWDMTALDNGSSADLFVTNVLNDTVAASPNPTDGGTVVRINLTNLDGNSPTIGSKRIIGQGFTERTDPNALVVGPTGLGLASDGTLYVADSANNRIASISNAATTTGPGPDGGTTQAPTAAQQSRRAARSTIRSDSRSPRTVTSSPPTEATATWSRPPRPATRSRSRSSTPPPLHPDPTATAHSSALPSHRRATASTSSTTPTTPSTSSTKAPRRAVPAILPRPAPRGLASA